MQFYIEKAILLKYMYLFICKNYVHDLSSNLQRNIIMNICRTYTLIKAKKNENYI